MSKEHKTIYIWRIEGKEKRLHHVSCSTNQASIKMRDELGLGRDFSIVNYLDTPYPLMYKYLFTTYNAYPTEEFVQQMKFLNKNN